jgi:TatD DNase family protein
MISLAGPVTYKNARALPEVARFVPEDRLVVETDCPYLTPTPHRGKRNEPAYVALTAAHVAALRGTDPEAFGESVTANAARLFKIALP